MAESKTARKAIEIYTDGACSGNPGPGGWGAVLCYRDVKKEISGAEPGTTNNRMELTAVISALEALKEPCDVTLYSDSRYIVDAVTKRWVYKWRDAGWMRTKTQPALNADLWQRLLELLEVHSVSFTWVKGHAENELNNRCDELAVRRIKEIEA